MALRSPELQVMIRAASKAARRLVRDFGEVEQLQSSRKGPGDFVSIADRRAEETIRAELEKARPDWALVLEESGVQGDEAHEFAWIVDPLDGTTNFLHGIPHFAINIALRRGREIVCALTYDPLRDEMFTAEKGGGAWMNDRRVRVSSRSAMDRAVIGCGLPIQNWEGRKAGFAKQLDMVADEAGGLRRLGAAALDLAYVASGRQDGYWEHGLKIWDMAAGVLIVQEAGGRIGRLEGDQDLFERGTLIAGSPPIYDRLRAILSEASPDRVGYDRLAAERRSRAPSKKAREGGTLALKK